MPQALLERGVDLGLLTALVSALVDRGEGGVAVVEGPPGVGKTRLIGATVDEGRARGALVLTAHGTELEYELAFGGVRQLLSAVLTAADKQERARILDGPAAGAKPVLGLADVPTAVPGEPLFALAALVSNLAEREPVLLAIDDIQWLDDASARFLVYLARRIEGQRILVVAARRVLDASPPQPIDELGELSTTTHIKPEPLSVDGVGQLLSTVLGATVGLDVATKSARLTGGNPYLVMEIARELAAMDTAVRAVDLEEIAPATIGSSVLGRIRRLAPPAESLAGAIALFPDGTTLADAAAVAGIPVRAAAAAADALVGAYVLAPSSSRLVFEHPVMRTAAYEQLGRFGRRGGHARAADVLMARGASVEEIAAHVLAGEPSGDSARVAIMEAAALDAERSGAVTAAVRYLARAMDEPPPADQWVRLGHWLGTLQGRAGMPDATTTLRAALERAPEELQVQIAIDLATVLDMTGYDDEAVHALLEVRSAAARDREQHLIVESLLSHFAWSSGSYGGLYAEIADALPTDLSGATPGERLALSQVGARMFDRCEPHEPTGTTLRRSLGLDGSPLIAWQVELNDTVNLLIHSGMLDAAADVCRRRQDLARATGRDSDYLASVTGLALIEWAQGDLPGCEASCRLGLEYPGGHLAARGALAGLLSRVCAAKGAFDEAEALLDFAVSTGGLSTSITWRRADLAMARGRTADAIGFFEEAHKLHVDRATLNPAEGLWRADYAEALAALDRRDDALDLLADFTRRAESFGEAQALGVASLAFGRLTAGGDGIEHLQRAVAILEPSPYRLTAARAQHALGSALRRANRRTESRDHLRIALDYADRNGAAPLATRAREELLAAGGRPRRHALTGVNALTPSEHRIAGLAAEGMSNRDIAAFLFVTVKTVEMHLGRSFEKLGIASRRELGGVLQA